MPKSNVPSRTVALSNFPARRRLYLAVAACSAMAFGSAAWAGPSGERITGGEASIERAGKVTTIEQASDRLAVEWDSYDLNADEVVNYNQPDAGSVALNRILSQSGSEIRGRINANGHVVLINPHGIVFGENARINVGGMLASGLDVNTDDFLNGDWALSGVNGTDGLVVNRGVINAATGGSVSLVGKQVRNEGLITAHLGAVNLAAGKGAVVTFDQSGLMGVRVSEAVVQDELGVNAALVNSGRVDAEGGRILLTASTSRDVFSRAVNRGDLEEARSVVMHEDGSFSLGTGADVSNSGTLSVSHESSAGEVVVLGENIDQKGLVEANNLNGDGGHIELHARETALVSGDGRVQARSASGGKGGQIKVLGEQVGLFDGAQVEVSGVEGGGEAFIGGDYQGKNSWLPNAHRTAVSASARIDASATATGDGGRIIVWADEATRFYGSLAGKGGSNGKGGFAEVSGKSHLAFDGSVDLSGPEGAGRLLLDPENINISQGAEDEDFDGIVDFSEPGIGGDDALAVTFESLGSILEHQQTTVELQATNTISITEGGTVQGTSGSELKLVAGKQIIVNGKSDFSNSAVTLLAGHKDCGSASCYDDGGKRSIVFGLDSGISTAGEFRAFAADSIRFSTDATLSAGTATLRSGDSINLSDFSTINTTSGNLNITAGDTSLYTGSDILT
uniref:two-partner secretion domain-containing protein n=1 Tax=Marinimicrobium locisalis TaxID=546022 RepID=UPI00322197C1